MIYDLIVIGLGPAGVTAAIYAKRAGLKVLCLEKAMVGGYLNFIDRIDNYPGLYGVSGPDFAFNLYNSIKELDIEVKNEEVKEIVIEDNKKIITEKDVYYANNIIIATGRSPRKLGLAHEEELYGRGISHCALCDGAFYRNKVVAVVGGGNSALQESLYLSNICQHVYIIHRKENFRVTGQVVDKVNEKENITTLMKCNVVELITGDEKLAGIQLDNGDKLDVDGLFVYVGFEPNTKFVKNINIIDDNGYIKVDSNYETSEKGIYAVGDIIEKEVYQISTSVGEGTIAATKIIDSIN